jgi:hypothetical protein
VPLNITFRHAETRPRDLAAAGDEAPRPFEISMLSLARVPRSRSGPPAAEKLDVDRPARVVDPAPHGGIGRARDPDKKSDCDNTHHILTPILKLSG